MFENPKIEAVARILAVTILLDQRQHDQEMVEFCHYLKTLNQELNPDVILPRQNILSWFEGEKPKLVKALSEDTDGSFKIEVLRPIIDPDLRQKVLTAVFAVSISDYEFHDIEMDFIKIALNLWKGDMPTMNDVSLMAS